MTVTLREAWLILALGLVTLGLDFGCEAHLLGAVERGPCQAKNPLGRGFLDGTCMPLLKCKQTLRGIIRLNFPVICGIELIRPIVCCPNMGPRGGGGALQGPTYPVPSQPLPPHSGRPPKQDNYPPAVSPPQPPRGNSPGTGPAPPQPGSGGPVVPPRPDNTPGKQPAVPAGGTNTPAEQGGPGAPCLDKPECEPGETDSYIHLIDPRRGKN